MNNDIAMTPDEIAAGVERLAPWFHHIDLGHGISTKTESSAGEPVDHPHGTWRFVREALSADLSGKSVLDVGCNAGFYAVEAKRRGARRVLGIDAQRHHIRQARFVRRALGLEIEFERRSVYDLNPHLLGQFDITLALGLLYHCKHLVLALENLWNITKEILIIESAVYPVPRALEFMRRRLGLTKPVVAWGRMTHLLAYVENPPEAREVIYNWFLPGVESLRALLKNQGFEEIDVISYKKDRALFVCRKPSSNADNLNLSQLAVKLTIEHGSSRCYSGEELEFRLRVENTGFSKWQATGEADTEKGAVRLGAHLLDESDEELNWDYGRKELEADVAAGESLEMSINVLAPARPGKYYIEFDMVAEQVTWFEDLGAIPPRQELNVVAPDVII